MQPRQNPDPEKLQALFEKFKADHPVKPRAARSRRAYLNPPAISATPAVVANHAAESATGETMSTIQNISTPAGQVEAERIQLEIAAQQLATAKAAAAQAEAQAAAATATAKAASEKAQAEADAAKAAAAAAAQLAAANQAKAEAEAAAAKATAEKMAAEAKTAADVAATTPKAVILTANILGLALKATATVALGIIGYKAYQSASSEDGPPAAP